MSLNKPEYQEIPVSSCGGVHVLLALWERFDLTFLLTQSGIFKLRGVPTWKLAFLVVAGLIARCSSCLQMVRLHAQETLLRVMLEGRIAQSTLSRFLTGGYAWAEFNRRRVFRLQQDPDTALREGDVVALDDSLVPHPYAKKIPFLFWLFDHCRRAHLWASNLVALHAVKQNGLEYPLFYALWDNTRTKFELSLEMLKDLRAALPEKLRLWLAVDRWYFNKDFLWALEGLSYDWVTKAKRNTVLYRLERGKKKTVTSG